ncbi:MAG: Smr/MutS family protein [Candidatus Sumerlaeota bacterium]|nr:Smr/MutS family protein [Candidatus Sumerlaeota bacterium]
MCENEPPEDEEESSSEPVELPIEDEIDLHAFSPRDVRFVVREYLTEAAKKGFVEVRLVHGKGVGVQRRIVQAELTKHPDVVEFWDAPPMRGHWGATIARLRAKD